MIPYGKQDIQQQDIDAVIDVLKSDYLTQGPKVPEFEEALCEYTGARHAVAVNSGTSALHLACLALELGPGDRLWTTPITFVASVNCGVYCGAEVDFVDIDPETCNLSVLALASKLEQAEQQGRLPKIVVAVHFCGEPCDMKAIHSLSVQYGFRVIEDACHAIGGRYKDEVVGSCRYSDVTVFSFHPVKVITTAEGGCAMTNSHSLSERMALLRNHGITRDSDMMTHEPDGPWYYQQVDLGFNYRMTDLQAALGISQLDRLDQYVTRRHEIAAVYDRELADFPLVRPRRDPDSYSALHLYVIRLRLDQISSTRRKVFTMLREEGIGVNIHYIPVHTQPFYREMGFHHGDYIEAERYYAEAISLPLYPTLSSIEQLAVIDSLKKMLVGS